MRDKPLGFQIWFVMTMFMLFLFVSVSMMTVFLIEEKTGIQINLLSTGLPENLSRLLISFVIVNIIFAKILANWITEPIRYLERQVRYIAQKNWNMPIALNRKDEIGKLAFSIGRMQESLKQLESDEEAFLQTISHDLKTPVMVIRSYCQAIKDGVYLDNSLDKTVQVVEIEAMRLEAKISKLLFLNSLDYELKKSGTTDRINVHELVQRIVNRFCFRRRDVTIGITNHATYIYGLEDKIEVALENIIDNGMRYAKASLEIEVREIYDYHQRRGRFVEIIISNDGELLDQQVLESLFDRFFKGIKGNFGLGLYITKRIIDYHKGDIWAENNGNKVSFKIILPELQV